MFWHLTRYTTTSRGDLVRTAGRTCITGPKEFKQIFPKPEWVEHNPEEIWSSQISVAFEALAKVSSKHADVIAIGITNQRRQPSCGTKKRANLFITR